MLKPLKVRIVSDSPAAVEASVNELLEDYSPIVWNIQASKDGPLVSCILILNSELRKAAILAAGMPAGRPV
jgi:hypothetical protein